MSWNKANITGQRFGRLVAVAPESRTGDGAVLWRCVCDCGGSSLIRVAALRNGNTKSCGCLSHFVSTAMFRKHGRSRTRTYGAWQHMLDRCRNPRHPGYALYGGAGVRVCERWASDFLAFLTDLGECPAGLELDRIDNARGYEPGNCRWVTDRENTRNRSVTIWIEHDGRRLSLTQWADELAVPYDRLRYRHRKRWPAAQLLGFEPRVMRRRSRYGSV